MKQRDINIGISSKDREISIEILNGILSSECVLLFQTLNYHWNLVGPQFHDYHLLFDDQYKAIFETIDALAERVRFLGGKAIGSMDSAIKHAVLKEDLGALPAPTIMVSNLLDQHEKLIRELRIAINTTAEQNRDMGSSNFLTDLIEKHEKTAWMLRSLTES